MFQAISQLFMLPVQAFVFSLQMLATTAEGFGKLASEGIETVLGETHIKKETEGSQVQASNSVPANPVADNTTKAIHTTETTRKEEKAVSISCDDNNLGTLDGKDLKLVRYKILFVKRGYEWAFPEQEELISDDFEGDDCGFTAWKIAEFIQALGRVPIPHKWKEKKYPKYLPDHKYEGEFIHWLAEEDKKYLRVYYQVLARYKREPQQDQVEVLQEIRDAILVKK